MVGTQMVPLSPGQFIFGRKAASKELKISERSIRTCLSTLKNLKKIGVKSTNKFSVITIIKWNTYQQRDFINDHQVTSKRPASDHKQECKNVRSKKLSLKVPFKESAKEEKVYKTKKGKALSGKRLSSFEKFWECFDYKNGKAEAADAWLNIPELTQSMVDQICSAAKIENSRRAELREKGRTPKMAQGWITGRRWEDETYSAQEQSALPDDFMKKFGGGS